MPAVADLLTCGRSRLSIVETHVPCAGVSAHVGRFADMSSRIRHGTRGGRPFGPRVDGEIPTRSATCGGRWHARCSVFAREMSGNVAVDWRIVSMSTQRYEVLVIGSGGVQGRASDRRRGATVDRGLVPQHQLPPQ